MLCTFGKISIWMQKKNSSLSNTLLSSFWTRRSLMTVVMPFTFRGPSNWCLHVCEFSIVMTEWWWKKNHWIRFFSYLCFFCHSSCNCSAISLLTNPLLINSVATNSHKWEKLWASKSTNTIPSCKHFLSSNHPENVGVEMCGLDHRFPSGSTVSQNLIQREVSVHSFLRFLLLLRFSNYVGMYLVTGNFLPTLVGRDC